MLEKIVSDAPVFLLVAVRCFAMIMTLPLFSSKTVPRMAKIAVAGFCAAFIFPSMTGTSSVYAPYSSYISADGSFSFTYVFLLAGEGLIGILIGLFVQMIFAAFSTAGQFFAFQMGLSASEVYDSLSQVENPLMGQFLNFLAMLVFLQEGFLHSLFIKGLTESFVSLNAFSIVSSDAVSLFLLKGLSRLFYNALIIALPLMCSLFLINVTVGILSKAAPQMNLLSEGFPILMLVSYFLIIKLIPYFVEFFFRTFTSDFRSFMILLSGFKGGM